jgi:HSP20 family molecular chaperone IbpA
MPKAFATRPNGTSRQADDPGPRVVELLRLLVAELGRIRDDQPDVENDQPPLMQWSGDEDVYLEAELAGSPPLEADVSVLGGKAFLRIKRTGVAAFSDSVSHRGRGLRTRISGK